MLNITIAIDETKAGIHWAANSPITDSMTKKEYVVAERLMSKMGGIMERVNIEIRQENE